MATPDWYPATLAQQLSMTPQTWAALQSHGIEEHSLLVLDFAFHAPTEQAADQLVAYLRLETDYEVDADHGPIENEDVVRWSVVGTTHPTAVSGQILTAWVEWMVAVGAQYGACRFDGWGAHASMP